MPLEHQSPSRSAANHTFRKAKATGAPANQMQRRLVRRRFGRRVILRRRQRSSAMANFPTHIGVGTVVSGALATATLATDVVAPRDLVAVTLAGVLGSVLPDIDLKESRPSRRCLRASRSFSDLPCCSVWRADTRLPRCSSSGSVRCSWFGSWQAIFFTASATTAASGTPCLPQRSRVSSTAAVFYWMLGRDESGVVVRGPVHDGRLPDPPDPRRDTIRRRHGYAHQGVLWYGLEVDRCQASGRHRARWRRRL